MKRYRFVRAALRPVVVAALALALSLPSIGHARDLTTELKGVVKLVEQKASAAQAKDLKTVFELQGKQAVPVHKSFVDAALGGDAVKNIDRQIKLLSKYESGRPAVARAIEDLRGTKAELERSGYMNFGDPSNAEPATAVILGGQEFNSSAFRKNVKVLAGKTKTRIGRTAATTLSDSTKTADFLVQHYRRLGLKVQLQAVKVGAKTKHNVVVTIPGKSRESVAITANYDGGATSADAAASAGLMEAGHSLAKRGFEKTIKLVHTVSDPSSPSAGFDKFAASSSSTLQAIISLGPVGSGAKDLQIAAGKGEVSAFLGSEVARASMRLNGRMGLTGTLDGPSKSTVPRITISGAGSGRGWSAAKSAQAIHAAVEATARVALPKARGKQKVGAKDLSPSSVYGSYRTRGPNARGAKTERDEFMDKSGNIRSSYQGIARSLAKTSARQNKATANRMVKDAKDMSAFTAYPRVMSADEFADVEKGLHQLERVMQAALKDVYSSNSILLKKGIITKAELQAAEGFDDYYKGVYGRKTNFDFVVRPDMIRGQDGRLKIIEVNQGYVGGIGDLVRLRKLLKSNNPEIFEGQNIKNIEGFHADLATHLKSLSPKKNPKVIFYLPGSTDKGVDNEDYAMVKEFKRHNIEYVTDTTKKQIKTVNGKVYLVTPGGKREQVDVVYSRKDSNTAGMETAHAWGNVKIFPTPGSSVFESKSLFDKFPAMIKLLLKEKPMLDFVTTQAFATKKGGVDKALLAKVMKNPSKYVIKVSNEAQGEGILIGKDASKSQLAAFKAKILKNPHNWSVQEYINPTTYNGQRVDFNPYLLSIKGKKIVPPGAMVRTAKLKGAKFGDNPKFMDVWVESKAKRRDYLQKKMNRKTSTRRSKAAGRRVGRVKGPARAR